MHVDRELLKELGGLRLATPGFASGRRQGDRRSPYRGRGVEFADYRAYAPGDDLRLVDWNVYARLQTVLVRLFHEDRNLSVHIALDASASMAFGHPRKSDHAASLAACVALTALLSQDSVTLGCVGGNGPRTAITAHNKDRFAPMLHLLERVEPAGEVDEPIHAIRAIVGGGRPDRFFFLSDMLYEDALREDLLRAIAAAGRRPVLLHVLSDEELRPDLEEPFKIEDIETGEEVFVKGGASAQKAYHEAFEAWLEEIRSLCHKLRIQYVPAHTTLDLRELVFGLLHKARVVESIRGGAQ